jgi:predicted dithiol-disulfide oxidoreductase (DUF899 family)
VSCFGGDFYRDVHLEFTPEGVSDTGNLVFYKDEAGQVFHTYSSYSRACEAYLGIYRIFDVMPKGRNENGPYHTMGDWVRPRNMYGQGGTVTRNGQYHPQACGCSAHAEAS